jgi:uncharacterized protein (TIGR03437 family)
MKYKIATGIFSAVLPLFAGGYGQLPLSFEVNQGQTDPAVKFLSRGDGYALFLTTDSAVFKLRPARGNSSPGVVRMKLAGANSRAKIHGEQTLAGTVNYFMGNDPKRWTEGIATFGKVNYQQIYRGIDLAYYGTERQLEYDFIVAPGADPKQIALDFSGGKPQLGPEGDLVLTLDGAPLIFRKPLVYQTIEGKKEMIAGNYKLSGDRVQFALGKYNHNRALVIDPVLSYLTYLGGSNTDEVGNTTYSASGNPTQGVAVDQAGNVYVTGYTQSTDFPVQGAIQGINTTNAPTGFVAKLNAAGSQLIYSTYIGGSVLQDNSTTRPYAIALDGSSNAYVTGFTSSPQFPVSGGAYQMVCGSVVNGKTNCPNAQSAFLTKLSPNGSLVYSTFLGHTNEIGVAVAVDTQGRAYVAGNTTDSCASNDPGNCFPTTSNAVLQGSAFNGTLNPGNTQQGSAFISVFDAAGANLLYSSLFGGNGNPSAGNNHPTFGSGVAVDPSGNFYLVGTTLSNQLPVTPGAFQTTYYGNPKPGFGTSSRGFVAKFSTVTSGASLVYTTYLGGFDTTVVSYQDAIAGIASDASGNVYISGNASYDFPATPGANNTTPCPSPNSCMNRGFLAKLNPAGSALVWATFVGTGLADPTLSAASTIGPPRLDALGNVYVSGVAGNNTEYPLVNPLQPANGFGGVYVTTYDPTGSTMYFSTVIYDPAANGGIFNSGVDVDSQGNIYVAGYTSQPGLPITAGAFQTAVHGSTDGFIAKIGGSLSPVPVVNAVVNGASFVGGGVVPGEIATVFGINITSATGINLVSGLPLQTSFLNSSVLVNGTPAPLFAVDNVNGDQINFQVPFEVAGTSSVQIAVSTNGATSAAFSAPVLTAQPGIINYSVAGKVFGVILHKNYVLVDAAHPAVGNEKVLIYCTGLGAVVSPPADGAPSSGQMTTVLPIVTIGGAKANVSFSGLAPDFVGLYQINATVPAGLKSGNQPVVINMAGASGNSALLPVK